MTIRSFLIVLLTLSRPAFCIAEIIEYDLNIAEKTVNMSGKNVKAITINGSIPGPTLTMTEGDTVRIRVHNHMDVDTSVHWHGILLPNQDDGVPYLNTPPIKPGATHIFEFPIIQSGTYWYHSHTNLQEQRGLYGSIVIHPRKPVIKTDHDYVLMLSDWTNSKPMEVMRTLKRGSDWNAVQKGQNQNLIGALRNGGGKDWVYRNFMMSLPAPDISDVYYEAFLANGKPVSHLAAKPGETVRVRIINGSSSTYYYLQFSGGGENMQIIAADGQDVQPVPIDRFLMGIAETYDVLITIPEEGEYELRATAQDGSGKTALFIGTGPAVPAPDVPYPDIYNQIDFSKIPSPYIPGSKMKKNVTRKQAGRPMAPYPELRATHSTVLPENRPLKEYKLVLTGDMERYVWSMNGKILSESDTIVIRRGENVRFTLVNKTMMHHPMHLHGHFFRVLNDQGEFSPLKHTVDVAPFTTQVIEFAANEEKDWFFHCHVLYHLEAGMARVVHYENSELTPDLVGIRKNLYHDPWWAWADASMLSNMTNGTAILENTRNIFRFEWEWDWFDTHEYDLSFTYNRYFNRQFQALIGLNSTNEQDKAIVEGTLGFRYLLPFNLDSSYWISTDGRFRLNVGRSIPITQRFYVFGEYQYDTKFKHEWLVGGGFIVNKYISLLVQHDNEYGTGGGVEIRF